MKPKILKLGILVLLFSFISTGCQKDNLDYDSNDIIGRWKWLYTTGGAAGATYPKEGQKFIWTFSADSMLYIPEGSYQRTINSKFSIKKDTLKFNYHTELELSYIFKISGDTLNLSGLGSEAVRFFKRIN